MLMFYGNTKTVNLKLKRELQALSNKELEIIKNKFGKSYLKIENLFFNTSHCENLSVAVINDTECGIDIEKIRKYNNRVAKKICSNREYNFLNTTNNKDYYFTALWVLKEAYVKCLGTGISVPLNKINFVQNNQLIIKQPNFIIDFIDNETEIIVICRKCDNYAGDSS